MKYNRAAAFWTLVTLFAGLVYGPFGVLAFMFCMIDIFTNFTGLQNDKDTNP